MGVDLRHAKSTTERKPEKQVDKKKTENRKSQKGTRAWDVFKKRHRSGKRWGRGEERGNRK